MSNESKALIVASMATYLRAFSQVIYLPSLANMRDDLKTSAVLIGLSISIYGLILAIAQLLSGPIVDRLDNRRLLLGGLSLFSIACLGAVWTPNVQVLLLARAFQAIGVVMAATVGIALVADLIPPDRRGRAMGVYELSNPLGGTLATLAGTAIALWFFWRANFALLALLGLFVLALAYRWAPPSTSAAQRVGLAEIVTILRTPEALSAIILGIAQFYGMYTLYTGLPLWFAEKTTSLLPGGNELWSGVLVTLLSASTILGAAFGGRRADALGSRMALLTGGFSSSALFLGITLTSTTPASTTIALFAATLAMAFGFWVGFSMPIQLKTVIDLFPRLRGTAGALLYVARFLGAAVAPLITGAFSDAGSLIGSFSAATSSLGICTATILLIHPGAPTTRRKARH